MSLRPRLVAASIFLGGALALSLLAVVSSSASLTASGKVSASLTKTSFTAAKAGSVKLVCRFSPTSKRWNYVLSRKSGSRWTKVRGLNRRGSFKGTYKTTVKKLFGSKPVKAGSYRVKVSADSNSVSRTFKVVKKPNSNDGSGGTDDGSGGTDDGSGGAIKPEAGHWVSTSLGTGHGGVTAVSFDVSASQTSVAGFSFEYDYSNPSCSGSARAWIDTASPISAGQFETPSSSSWSSSAPGVAPASGTFRGTFDSATKAHGTAQMLLMVSCGSYMTPSNSGTFSWTASRAG